MTADWIGMHVYDLISRLKGRRRNKQICASKEHPYDTTLGRSEREPMTYGVRWIVSKPILLLNDVHIKLLTEGFSADWGAKASFIGHT